MSYGNLICIKKGKRYCGKSVITNKALYRVIYEVFFYKTDEKRLGYIDGKEYTFSKSFYKKSEMDNFLKGVEINGNSK
jgi:guanylate kinase